MLFNGLVGRGKLYERMKKYDLAVENYEEAGLLLEDSPKIFLRKAQCYRKL